MVHLEGCPGPSASPGHAQRGSLAQQEGGSASRRYKKPSAASNQWKWHRVGDVTINARGPSAAFRVEMLPGSDGGSDMQDASSSSAPMGSVVLPPERSAPVDMWVLPQVQDDVYHVWRAGILDDMDTAAEVGENGLRLFRERYEAAQNDDSQMSPVSDVEAEPTSPNS